MLKCLSGLSDEQLNYYLSRVREIAAHDDAAALIETDKLLWEMLELLRSTDSGDDEEEDESEYASVPTTSYGYSEDVEYKKRRLRAECQRLKHKMDAGSVRSFDMESFRYHTDRFLNAQHPSDSVEDEELNSIKAECRALLLSAEAAIFHKILEDALHSNLKNINSVMAVDEGLKFALERYSKYHEPTPDILKRVREARERAARFRSERKLANAKIADEAGFSVKATGLRREAVALLAQDWESIFPGEKPTTD